MNGTIEAVAAKRQMPRSVAAMNPERKDRHGTVVQREGTGKWIEVGLAWEHEDGSITIVLDALPITGKLFIRPRDHHHRPPVDEVVP